LNQSPYQSIPDDGDNEFPKFNLYRIWNFQNGVIQTLQLYHTYTETICPIYIMLPLVVGKDKAFKTMALCTYNKVYKQKVLFTAFFTFTVTHCFVFVCLYSHGAHKCQLLVTAQYSRLASWPWSMLLFSSVQEYQSCAKSLCGNHGDTSTSTCN
jgi:hypothetical protein